jgi:hypothetical protein
MNVALRHGLHGFGAGMQGLGDAESDFNFDYDWITSDPDAGYAVTRDPGIPFGPQPPLTDIIPYGMKVEGQMTGPVPPLNTNQLAAAIKAGTVVLSKTLGGGGKVCPSGYATPQGACVPVQDTAGSSQALIPGISNQTLAIVGISLFALVMMSGGRRR